MHKSHIALTAALLSAIIAGAVVVYPWLSQFDILRWLYFPAILLSVLLSENMHSPSAIAVWVNFVFSTLFYWVIFLVFYAFLCELRIRHQAFRHLDDVEQDVAAGKTDSLVHPLKVGQSLGLQQSEDAGCSVAAPDTTMNLKKIGDALKAVEERRRKYFFLRNVDSLDLTLSSESLAEQAITQPVKERLVEVILKRLESDLAAEISHKAVDLMTKDISPPAGQVTPHADKAAMVQDLSKRLESQLADKIGAADAADVLAEARPLLEARAMPPSADKIGPREVVAVMAKVIPPLAIRHAAVRIGSLAAAALMKKLQEDAKSKILAAREEGAANKDTVLPA